MGAASAALTLNESVLISVDDEIFHNEFVNYLKQAEAESTKNTWFVSEESALLSTLSGQFLRSTNPLSLKPLHIPDLPQDLFLKLNDFVSSLIPEEKEREVSCYRSISVDTLHQALPHLRSIFCQLMGEWRHQWRMNWTRHNNLFGSKDSETYVVQRIDFDAKVAYLVRLSDSVQNYFAVSYRWDSTVELTPFIMKLDTGEEWAAAVSVAQLRQVRSYTTEPFWLDKCCIDQASNESKRRHIAVMGYIYAFGTTLCVTEDGKLGVSAEYFARAWTHQEFTWGAVAGVGESGETDDAKAKLYSRCCSGGRLMFGRTIDILQSEVVRDLRDFIPDSVFTEKNDLLFAHVKVPGSMATEIFYPLAKLSLVCAFGAGSRQERVAAMIQIYRIICEVGFMPEIDEDSLFNLTRSMYNAKCFAPKDQFYGCFGVLCNVYLDLHLNYDEPEENYLEMARRTKFYALGWNFGRLQTGFRAGSSLWYGQDGNAPVSVAKEWQHRSVSLHDIDDRIAPDEYLTVFRHDPDESLPVKSNSDVGEGLSSEQDSAKPESVVKSGSLLQGWISFSFHSPSDPYPPIVFHLPDGLISFSLFRCGYWRRFKKVVGYTGSVWQQTRWAFNPRLAKGAKVQIRAQIPFGSAQEDALSAALFDAVVLPAEGFSATHKDSKEAF
eukprot:gene24499-32953_t